MNTDAILIFALPFGDDDGQWIVQLDDCQDDLIYKAAVCWMDTDDAAPVGHSRCLNCGAVLDDVGYGMFIAARPHQASSYCVTGVICGAGDCAGIAAAPLTDPRVRAWAERRLADLEKLSTRPPETETPITVGYAAGADTWVHSAIALETNLAEHVNEAVALFDGLSGADFQQRWHTVLTQLITRHPDLPVGIIHLTVIQAGRWVMSRDQPTLSARH